MNSPDPVPANFGLRYVFWFLWSNALTGLSILQAIFASIMLAAGDPTDKNPLISHSAFRWIVIGNAVLMGIIAQVKRNNPPGPAPTSQPKGDDVKKVSMFLLAGVIGVLLAAGGLTGCSIFNTTNNALNTGIELATSVYITHKGGGTPAGDLQAAQQVKAVAVELQGVATGSLTVAQFNAQMSAYIAKLNPTEQILAAGLLTQIDFYLAQQVSNNVLSASLSAQANVVLGDVIAACALYGA